MSGRRAVHAEGKSGKSGYGREREEAARCVGSA